jgi:antitoxin (DNA-binding transcriptional repressor) of toxin-antitoxin stability system
VSRAVARRVIGCALLAGAGALAGCTGVPTTSSPDTVEHLGAAPLEQQAPQPPPGADPRSLVIDFLAANQADAINHGVARSFLAGQARDWDDTNVTIVSNTQVGFQAPDTVTVTGQAIGTLSSNGIYRPDLNGDGEGGESVPVTFKVQKVDGQNRITRLFNGLLLTESQFEAVFQQRVAYFYDDNERYLVPDLRYTALGDPQTVATWLVNQLLAGPRPELQNAETNLEFPAQATKVTVKVGNPLTTIEVPGAAQLDAAHVARLAAQLAITLDQVVPGGSFEITDNGRPVTVPAAQGAEFTAGEFAAEVTPPSVPPNVYFIRGDGVYDETARPLPGDLGRGTYHLGTVALARLPRSTDLHVAGTTGHGAAKQLLIGTPQHGLHTTAIRGDLTRPSWAPGLDEAWIASGSRLFRVATDGRATPVPIAGLPADARITALRMSPDGSRIATVVAENRVAQVYVGTVARNGTDVRIEAAVPVTPIGVRVLDVAWNDPLKLFLIGVVIDTGAPEVVEVQADGSFWNQRGVGDLPPSPRWITVTQNQPAWVSSGGSVWTQNGVSWVSPVASGETAGQAPVYLE